VASAYGTKALSQARKKQFSPEREARTTATGLLRFADEYRLAAETVQAASGDKFSAPAMYLIAHSVELGLKAFLRSRGATLKDLLDVGHSLQDLYREAMRRHLQWLWPEAGMVAETIQQLDEVNQNHAMRYIINGSTKAPQWWTVSGCALGLIRSLHRHCLRRTFGREDGEKLAGVRKPI
jgi:HEPN domain-containing protein